LLQLFPASTAAMIAGVIDDAERWAGKYFAHRVNQAPVATLSVQA
jgi:hypothetical protein